MASKKVLRVFVGLLPGCVVIAGGFYILSHPQVVATPVCKYMAKQADDNGSIGKAQLDERCGAAGRPSASTESTACCWRP